MLFNDVTAATLTSALRGYEARNLAISSNLANAETPGYRRVEVSFESALAAAADEAHGAGRTTGAAAVAAITPTRSTGPATAMRTDASNIDPDSEMAALAQNQLAHQTVTSLLDKHLTLIRTAIIGR